MVGFAPIDVFIMRLSFPTGAPLANFLISCLREWPRAVSPGAVDGAGQVGQVSYLQLVHRLEHWGLIASIQRPRNHSIWHKC